MQQHTCSRCGTLFVKKTHTQRFCSKACREHPCPACGKITENRTFCSTSCAVRINNTTRKITYRRKTLRNCPACGAKTYNKSYCSTECHRVTRHAVFVEKWLAGEITGAYVNGEAAKAIRRWIRKRDDDKCSQCGWAEINPMTGTSPIAMDHIDGNATNNRPENLRMLCPNCHSLTPTYGSLNRGFGRPSRRRARRDDATT